jgi:hypothetical protein
MERLFYLAANEGRLNFQLTGGGASAVFYRGMTSDEVIFELRRLAEILERGVAERQKVKP